MRGGAPKAAACAAAFLGALLALRGLQGPHTDGADRQRRNEGGDSDEFLEEWFLNAAEIRSAMGFRRRSNLPTFTRGNDVAMLVDGEEVLGTMWQEIKRATGGDGIYGAFWAAGGKYKLAPLEEESSLTNVFGAAIDRGVDLRLLMYDNPTAKCEMEKFTGEINRRGGQAEMLGFPTLTGSHHQKMLGLRINGSYSSAYVGGVDPASQRWDTPLHTRASEAKKFERASQPVQLLCDLHCNLPCDTLDQLENVGWHDVGAWIWGPGAADVGATFIERWNARNGDDTLEMPVTGNLGADATAAATTVADGDPIGSASGDGPFGGANGDGLFGGASADHSTSIGHAARTDVSVQTLRTYPCVGGSTNTTGQFDFAPKGETTILAAQVKAINRAQHYIYIEDQYFWSVPELKSALYNSLSRVRYLVVVIQGTQSIPGTDTFASQMVDRLKRHPDAGSKLKLYSRGDGVYVHTKTTVIDDVYVNTGTANRNYRSMTHDSEVAVSAIDPALAASPATDGMDARVQARVLRHQLWADHSHEPLSSFTDTTTLDEAVGFLDAGLARGDLLSFKPKNVGVINAVSELLERDGRCGADTCWETPRCLWTVVGVASAVLLLLIVLVWYWVETVEFVLYTARYFCFRRCNQIEPDSSRVADAPDISPLMVLTSETCFAEKRTFVLDEQLKFSTLLGVDQFVVRDDIGQPVLEVKSVNSVLNALKPGEHDRLEIRLPGSDGRTIAVVERKAYTACCGCIGGRTFSIYRGEDRTDLMGRVRKARLLPLYRLHTLVQDRTAEKLRRRPDLVAEGNFTKTDYRYFNSKREVVARAVSSLFQLESNNSYRIDLAAGMDLAVVVAVCTIIDEISED